MPEFHYDAISESGMIVSGSIEADSLEAAKNLLSSRGYIPTDVRAETPNARSELWTRIRERIEFVKAPQLILFTKQFRSMLHAGVPILRLFQVLEAQTDNRTLKRCIGDMSQDIKQGSTLYEAMEKHPAIFSPLYRSMIRAGEASGNVPDIMDRLIYIIEHEHRIKSDVRSALQYPMIVLFALFAAFFVLLTFVIPKFAMVFSRVGLQLPLPTRIAMALYSFLSAYWYIVLAVVAVIVIGLRYYFKTTNGKYVRDALILRLPILGPLFVKAIMSRFASIFAILQSSGVPVVTAMNILSGTIGNNAVAREFDRVREQVEEGQGIAVPLRSAKHFTPMVIDMIAIGEEAGNIDEMLKEISVHYDDEVNYAVRGLSDAIGPILVIGLAAVVGFFALAIFLPMWDLTKMVR
ncbi:MAG: type II secretion system F family protein [Smithellaceae bacterium]|nr:type II secretion system F family protein [Smithellaceae bacterium]